jgi:hypothetical protein
MRCNWMLTFPYLKKTVLYAAPNKTDADSVALLPHLIIASGSAFTVCRTKFKSENFN